MKIKHFHRCVNKVKSETKVKIKIDNAYDIQEMKKNLLNALPDKVIAMLKDDYIKSN